VDVPDFLKTQVREGKVVVVLGAGASRGAVAPDNNEPPDGKGLARLLADRFLGGQFSTASLSQVSEYAISESSLVDVQEFIRGIFEKFEPAPFHRLLPKFRWHGLATTNFDRIVEKAYEAERDPLQVLQPIISNGDRLQDALRSPDSVLLLKLHGCISRTADADCPLILTTDQYIQYKVGRSRLFTTLQEWAYDRPLVFVGHSIQDPDLRAILLELTALGDKRARCFGVVPDADDVAARYWESKKLTLLKGTCKDFLETLNNEIPQNTRVLAGLLRAQENHPIAERFKSPDTALSDTCRSFLTNDVEYVRSATSPRVDPKHFYRGLSPGWAPIEQNLDVRRKLADTVLTDVVLADPSDHPNTVEVILIKGHAGAGKSVLLRRIAWDAAHDYQAVALFVQPQGALAISAIRELLAAIDERLYLFVDDAVDRTREIATLIRDVGVEGKRLTLLIAERINEWNVGGGIVDPYITEEYTIPYLERSEIASLVDLLGRHRALGTLEQAKPDERVMAFEQRAGRQLLVALHEATLGRPFEDIIKDEYDNIVPAEAQEMYLSICVLNRLNVPVRAGLIARMHDIPFSFFEQRFFRPLEHVVQTSYDAVLRDHTYAARHPQIAEIVFQRVLTDAEARLDKYLRCLQALNLDYSTDERAFRHMVRGRIVLELFPSTEMAQHVFRVARATAGDEPYLLQQMALYEMNRPSGSLDRAAELLDAAATAAPYDQSVKHSRAELLLRLADSARTSLEREQRLREAMRIAGSLRDERPGRQDGSHAFHTIVKVGLRRLEDVLQETATVSEEAVTSAIKAVEDSLQDGLQRFPDDSYLLTSEAQLATLLKDSGRAITAMRSAFKTNPRNSVIAIRLAKSLEALNDIAAARATIQTGLDNNPGDKRLHYTFAKLLLRHEPQAADQIEYHLQRSFTTGDANYDAQLLYARQLYARGDVEGAKRQFRTLSAARVGPDVRDRMRYPLQGWFTGRVVRLEATYGFVSRDGIGDWVFVHRSEVRPEYWTNLRIGSRVRFQIAFTMKGQGATNLSPEALPN
jgi:cold shock CspA family protein/tetratricopeptide (TPR) repeat protein